MVTRCGVARGALTEHSHREWPPWPGEGSKLCGRRLAPAGAWRLLSQEWWLGAAPDGALLQEQEMAIRASRDASERRGRDRWSTEPNAPCSTRQEGRRMLQVGWHDICASSEMTNLGSPTSQP